MKLWIDLKYEATLEDGETEADRSTMDDIILKCQDELDAAVLAAAKTNGLDVRFTFD